MQMNRINLVIVASHDAPTTANRRLVARTHASLGVCSDGNAPMKNVKWMAIPFLFLWKRILSSRTGSCFLHSNAMFDVVEIILPWIDKPFFGRQMERKNRNVCARQCHFLTGREVTCKLTSDLLFFTISRANCEQQDRHAFSKFSNQMKSNENV